MTFTQAHEELKGYDVKSITVSGNLYEIVIGSAGRKLDSTRRFQAKSLDTLVKRIKDTYK